MTTATQTKIPQAVYNSRLLTVRQVLEMLKISKSTLFRFLRNKNDPIPSIKLNKSLRFQADKLMWWIEKHEQ